MMKYNICIIKNRLPKQLDLQKYLVDWFNTYTPLEMEVSVIETDFDVKTKNVTNGTFTGVIVDSEDIIPKLKTVIPENKYNTVLFIYGNNLNGIRVSACDGSVYPDTELIQTYIYDDKGKTANHELFHAFFQKLRKCQIGLQDPMDTYIQNNNLIVDNFIDTNREMALNILKPYWDKICAFRYIINNPTPVTTSKTWRYFKSTEKTGSFGTVADLEPTFVDKMDIGRGESGISWVITSGYRIPEQNKKVGGSPTSSHLERTGVDIRARNWVEVGKIVDGARKAGITGITVYKDSLHVHLDMKPYRLEVK